MPQDARCTKCGAVIAADHRPGYLDFCSAACRDSYYRGEFGRLLHSEGEDTYRTTPETVREGIAARIRCPIDRPPQTGQGECMAAKSRTKDQILAKVRAAKARIAKERDGLRSLIDELEDLHGSADDAVDALEEAADRLSEYL